jgi:hypothetical protein
MRTIIALLALIGTVSIAPAAPRGMAVGPNLVVNPGFEEMADGQPVAWQLPSKEYTISTDGARTGTQCLRFENADAGKYLLCAQTVKLEKGRRYELTAWVRSESIMGEDTGATICLEFWGADNKYLFGSYPKGVKGANGEWTQVRGISGAVPEEAVRANLTCYVRKGMTGVAYWDDLALRLYVPPLAEGITTDRYRNETTGGPVRVNVGLSLGGTNAKPEDVKGKLEVRNQAGEILMIAEPSKVLADQAEFVIGSTALPVGDYQIHCRFSLPDDPATGQETVALHRVAKATERKVYIDQYQRVIVDGKPFFPLGMYWGSVNEKHLDIYADSPFNCLMPYGRPKGEQLDWIHDRGLKVICSIKDYYAGTKWCPKEIQTIEDERPAVEQAVAECKDHPAVLAWYLNDELPRDMMERLNSHQEWLEELDPDHPTWVVLYQINDVRCYLSSSDALGTDPYPISTSPASRALDWATRTRNAGFGRRSVWQVPQVFDWRAYKKSEEDQKKYRAPTLLEIRSMAWQSIAAGSNGLIFYSWFDLHKMDKVDPFETRWAEVKTMAAEVKKLIPAILSVEETPKVAVEAPEGVAWTLRQLGADTYVIVVNSAEEPASATFRFPATVGKVSHEVGQGGVQRNGKELAVSFTALEPKVLRISTQ